MEKQGGRESLHSHGHRHPTPENSGRYSSSHLDEMDVEILSLIKDRPMTILHLSERMDIPFLEGLARMRKLWKMGFLERAHAEDEEIGLYRYSVIRGY